jgi:hypothetical protein
MNRATTRYAGIVATVVVTSLMAGCALFDTRDPEPPIVVGGTYLQPDTPEQVVANLISAVGELNTLNYRRSFSDEFVFQPTASAEASSPIWNGWGVTNEEQYFSALSAAGRFGSNHRLLLTDESPTPVSDRLSIVDSNYELTINHNRPEIPTSVEGQLRWEIEQGTDGLWRLAAWTDREVSSASSWSDLKAEFVD